VSAFNLTRFNLLSGSITPTNKAVVMFDGKAMDANISGLHILNITIGGVDIESNALARKRRAGSDFRWKRNATRTITILVELPLSKNDYADNVRKLRAWAESTEPKALRLPVHKSDLIYATLTSFSEFTLREWWNPIELVFTCWDPYFENVSENMAQIESTFTIGGNGDPSVHLTYNLDEVPLTDPEWRFEDGKTIKLTGTFNSGELDINFDRLTIYQNGTSVMRKLTLASRFPEFVPGTYQITGPSGGIVRWKERWA